MLDDLFWQLPLIAAQARQVPLMSGRDQRDKPGRVFVGPLKPDRWRRTPEQNHEKYQRYLKKHGRAHINALRRAKHA
jgi:hypothetical protein